MKLAKGDLFVVGGYTGETYELCTRERMSDLVAVVDFEMDDVLNHVREQMGNQGTVSDFIGRVVDHLKQYELATKQPIQKELVINIDLQVSIADVPDLVALFGDVDNV